MNSSITLVKTFLVKLFKVIEKRVTVQLLKILKLTTSRTVFYITIREKRQKTTYTETKFAE